jgi:hypothetical protein
MPMGDTPYKLIRHQRVRNIDAVLVFHNENIGSWMVHIRRLLMIAIRMHQESGTSHSDFLPELSFRQLLTEIPATLVHFLER